jgi:hypothetical protein
LKVGPCFMARQVWLATIELLHLRGRWRAKAAGLWAGRHNPTHSCRLSVDRTTRQSSRRVIVRPGRIALFGEAGSESEGRRSDPSRARACCRAHRWPCRALRASAACTPTSLVNNMIATSTGTHDEARMHASVLERCSCFRTRLFTLKAHAPQSHPKHCISLRYQYRH